MKQNKNVKEEYRTGTEIVYYKREPILCIFCKKCKEPHYFEMIDKKNWYEDMQKYWKGKSVLSELTDDGYILTNFLKKEGEKNEKNQTIP